MSWCSRVLLFVKNYLRKENETITIIKELSVITSFLFCRYFCKRNNNTFNQVFFYEIKLFTKQQTVCCIVAVCRFLLLGIGHCQCPGQCRHYVKTEVRNHSQR